MKEIVLDGAAWKTEEDFYAALLQGVGAPNWHGHNLDALNESFRSGDINQLSPPITVQIGGVASMGSEVRHMVGRFRKLVQDLKRSGVEIVVRMKP